MFIESICNDEAVLEANYRYKMQYSPDYQGVDVEEALRDFKQRIRKYNEVGGGNCFSKSMFTGHEHS
jgi:6-phosphofructo-2-kinase/fructose-2,6-biphosphatase